MQDYPIEIAFTEKENDLTVLYKDDKAIIHEIKAQSDEFFQSLRFFQKKRNEINITKLVYIEEDINYDIFVNFLDSIETKKIILNEENYPKFLYLSNKYEYIELEAKIKEFINKRPDLVSVINQLTKSGGSIDSENKGQFDFAKEELVSKNLDICIKNGLLSKVPLGILNRILNSPKRVINDHQLLFSFVLGKLKEFKENEDHDDYDENIRILPSCLDYSLMTNDEMLELFEFIGEKTDFISPSKAEERLKIFISNEKRNEQLSSQINQIEIKLDKQVNDFESTYNKRLDELDSKCSKNFDDFKSTYNERLDELDSKCSKSFDDFDSNYKKKFADFDAKNCSKINDVDQKCSKQLADLDAKYSNQIKQLEMKFENKIQEMQKQHQNEVDSLRKIIDGLKQKIDSVEKESQSNITKNEKRIQSIENKEVEFERNQKKLQEEIDSQKGIIGNLNQVCPKRILFDNNENNRFNGIISWLGDKNPENLVDKGIINITASSVYSDESCRQPKNILNYKDSQECFDSKIIANSWLCIDFKKNRVNVLQYSIQAHGRSSDHHLLSWDIEGSNDNSSWDVLDSRRDEKSISSRGSSNTFEAQNANNREKYFRYIRIKQTGKDSSGNDELYFSSIEFFGHILRH